MGYDFCDDLDKMKDFFIMSKDDFMASYSYLHDEDYEATKVKTITVLTAAKSSGVVSTQALIKALNKES